MTDQISFSRPVDCPTFNKQMQCSGCYSHSLTQICLTRQWTRKWPALLLIKRTPCYYQVLGMWVDGRRIEEESKNCSCNKSLAIISAGSSLFQFPVCDRCLSVNFFWFRSVECANGDNTLITMHFSQQRWKMMRLFCCASFSFSSAHSPVVILLLWVILVFYWNWTNIYLNWIRSGSH